MQEIRYLEDRHNAVLAAGLVGYALGYTPEIIMGSDRGARDLVKARQVAMYLTYIGFGMSLARVANAFDRDRSTVAYACRVIEDRRYDDAFNVWMETLEKGLTTVAPLNRDAA